MLARALLCDPGFLLPKAKWQQEIHWWSRPESSVMTGLLFTDGSCLRLLLPAARRAGCAIAQLSEGGEVLVAAYGPCTRELCFQQAITEDFAAMMLLQVALPPLIVYPDCLSTGRTVNAEGAQ